jgi:hypothetical protein
MVFFCVDELKILNNARKCLQRLGNNMTKEMAQPIETDALVARKISLGINPHKRG